VDLILLPIGDNIFMVFLEKLGILEFSDFSQKPNNSNKSAFILVEVLSWIYEIQPNKFGLRIGIKLSYNAKKAG
jgi:hypothetical protein